MTRNSKSAMLVCLMATSMFGPSGCVAGAERDVELEEELRRAGIPADEIPEILSDMESLAAAEAREVEAIGVAGTDELGRTVESGRVELDERAPESSSISTRGFFELTAQCSAAFNAKGFPHTHLGSSSRSRILVRARRVPATGSESSRRADCTSVCRSSACRYGTLREVIYNRQSGAETCGCVF